MKLYMYHVNHKYYIILWLVSGKEVLSTYFRLNALNCDTQVLDFLLQVLLCTPLLVTLIVSNRKDFLSLID